MKWLVLTVLLAGLASAPRAAENAAFADDTEKTSYSMGMMLAGGWKRQAIDVNVDALLRGIKDTQAGKTVITEEEARTVLAALSKRLQAKQAEARKAQDEVRKVQGEKNKTEGPAFLAENKTKPGVIALPSGLQYKVLLEGKGE